MAISTTVWNAGLATGMILGLACGSAVIQVSPEGTSGSGGAGAGAEGGAGADGGGGVGGAESGGGGSVAIDPAWDAYCEGHAETYCERAFACSPILATYQSGYAADVDQCARIRKRWCLEVYARKDAASVEARWACLADWPLECHAYVGYTFGVPGDLEPQCFLPGARTLGAPCSSHSQCQSLYCAGDGGECGTCAEPEGVGSPCGFGSPYACGEGQGCYQDVCTAASGPGGACKYGGFGPEQVCIHATCEDGVCLVPALDGEPCGDAGCEPIWHQCVDGICVADEMLPPGAPCDFPQLCSGAFCSEGVCTPYQAAGEPCTSPEHDCEPGLSCLDGTCQLDLSSHGDCN